MIALRRLTLAAAVALSATTAVATAEAGVVVVLSVRGSDDGDLERMLGDAVAEDHELRNDTDYSKVARREGVSGSDDPRDIATVARILGADVIVDPSLRREDGGYVLRIKLRDRTGKVAKTMVVKMRKPRLGTSGKRDVAKELADTLSAVLDRRGGGSDRDRARDDRDDDEERDDGGDDRRVRDRDRDDDDDEERDDRRARDDEDDDERDGRRVRDRDDEDEDDRFDEDDDEDDRGRRRRRRRAGEEPREIRRAGVVVEAGTMALKRTLSFSSQADLEMAPRGYTGSFVPAARFSIELYPVAFSAPKNVAAGLGVYAEYDRAFLLSTKSDRVANLSLPTEQTHWSIGARFRYAFGDAPNLPSIILGGGYSRRAFMVDRSALPADETLDLPDVDYKAIEVGAQLRVPIGTERLVLGLAGQGLLFRDAGPIQDPSEYGAAKVTGVEGSVTIDAAITRRVLLRLRGGIAQIGFDFTGNGRMSNNRDSDPEQDVGGALDRWLGAAASLGVMY